MRVNSHHLKNRLLGLCPEIRSSNQGRDCYITLDEDIGDILKDPKERNYNNDAVVLAKAADIIRRKFRTEVSSSLDQIDCQDECIPKTLLRFTQIDILYSLGLSISYERVLEIVTATGDKICERFELEKTVCPPTLRKGLFTYGAIDNIDHNPSSSTSQSSFHGTGQGYHYFKTENRKMMEKNV